MTQLSEIRRARPVLGTLVEITARGTSAEQLAEAVNASFTEIQRVHDLMSFHERGSDISRVNRLAHRIPVRVHPWTWRVLLEARNLARKSRGAFNITVADRLVRWGYLPCPISTRAAIRGDWHDVRLLPGHRVRLDRRVLIDLGGIAKGFAVDLAVAALQRHHVQSGLVNAGGDLRGFGSRRHVVHLRHPAYPGVFLPAFELDSGALATSAAYFAQRVWRGRRVAPVVSRTGRPSITATSVTVAARTCMRADALTKVCLLNGSSAARRLGGRAFVLAAEELSPRLLAA
ncbi:MAG: hypothetical protein C5B46_08400 [Proteobacteria bacterium]|nr:MAG: hypothetical protein C5B46_08400 [Pseudomonadota bacterium]